MDVVEVVPDGSVAVKYIGRRQVRPARRERALEGDRRFGRGGFAMFRGWRQWDWLIFPWLFQRCGGGAVLVVVTWV